MDLDAVWQVGKWVLLVLLAGFIGQFGRHFAKALLERRRRKASQAPEGSKQGAAPSKTAYDVLKEGIEAEAELKKKELKEMAKLEKKRAKAEVKREKKRED